MKHIEIAIGVIHQASWVLICQRHRDDAFANLWEFPGGKIEPGESPEACVVREVGEELGMGVKVTAPFPVIDHTYPDFTIRIWPYLCTPTDGDPRPLASQRLQWVQADRLRDFSFPAANARLIGQVSVRLASCEIPEFCEAALY